MYYVFSVWPRSTLSRGKSGDLATARQHSKFILFLVNAGFADAGRMPVSVCWPEVSVSARRTSALQHAHFLSCTLRGDLAEMTSHFSVVSVIPEGDIRVVNCTGEFGVCAPLFRRQSPACRAAGSQIHSCADSCVADSGQYRYW